LLSRVFSQAVRSRLLFLLPLVLSVQVAWSSALGPSKPNSPQSAAPSFNSTRAMQYVREVVAFGPRAIGSGNHKKVENYIHAHLKGDLVEDDAFTATTPEGKFPVRNIIAKFPGTRDGIIVVAGHYDTNYPLRKTGYVGANDGGSSTALLLELADLIDLDYGYNDVFHHTPQDTIDKLSPKSMEIVGIVILETVRLLDERKQTHRPKKDLPQSSQRIAKRTRRKQE